jgi:hypothetical protein
MNAERESVRPIETVEVVPLVEVELASWAGGGGGGS